MTSHQKRSTLQCFLSGLVSLGIFSTVKGELSSPSCSLPISWIHGHATDIGFPEQIECATSTGASKLIRGCSFSTQALHYAFPVPPGRPRLIAILLRFRTLAGASIRAIQIFDGELPVVEINDIFLQNSGWDEHRIGLAAQPFIERGLGVTVQIGFQDIERQIEISSIGAQFSVDRSAYG